MEGLAKRVHYLFDNVVFDAELIIAYFKYRDRPNSLRGGVFFRDMLEPQVKTLNPWAFQKFQREGDVFKWVPPKEFYNINTVLTTPNIIPVESLVKLK